MQSILGPDGFSISVLMEHFFEKGRKYSHLIFMFSPSNFLNIFDCVVFGMWCYVNSFEVIIRTENGNGRVITSPFYHSCSIVKDYTI